MALYVGRSCNRTLHMECNRKGGWKGLGNVKPPRLSTMHKNEAGFEQIQTAVQTLSLIHILYFFNVTNVYVLFHDAKNSRF